MARSVPYLRQTFNHPNPLARFAHRSRYARSLGLIDQIASEGAVVLDFGAGTGEWLRQLRTRRPDLDLIGYEPFKAIEDSSLATRATMDEVERGSVDVLCAFEVLEHLNPDDIASFISHALRVVRPGGRVVVSVPIVEGAALPFKLGSHAVLFRNLSGYTMREIAAGVIGRPIARTTDLFWSHKGFSHRTLARSLGAAFETSDTVHSPFTVLPWWLNSQVFWVLKPHAAF